MSKACSSLRLLLIVATLASTLAADEERVNTPVVAASETGYCYARSVPASGHGSDGSTTVYTVRSDGDHAIATFDWYSAKLFLGCGGGPYGDVRGLSVVRLGPWARGHQASSNDLAIAFYFGGKLVKQYSTLDIAGAPDNVRASKSHYVVFQQIDGYRSRLSSTSGNVQTFGRTFEVITSVGNRIIFDPTTGAKLPDRPLEPR